MKKMRVSSGIVDSFQKESQTRMYPIMAKEKTIKKR